VLARDVTVAEDRIPGGGPPSDVGLIPVAEDRHAEAGHGPVVAPDPGRGGAAGRDGGNGGLIRDPHRVHEGFYDFHFLFYKVL